MEFTAKSLYFITLRIFSSAVGGGEDLRRYWSEYLSRTHVLVYVVDSSDRSRLPLAKTELHRLLRVEPQLPVVILGNKQVNQMSWIIRTLRLADTNAGRQAGSVLKCIYSVQESKTRKSKTTGQKYKITRQNLGIQKGKTGR